MEKSCLGAAGSKPFLVGSSSRGATKGKGSGDAAVLRALGIVLVLVFLASSVLSVSVVHPHNYIRYHQLKLHLPP